jgi:hypothetical protein
MRGTPQRSFNSFFSRRVEFNLAGINAEIVTY